MKSDEALNPKLETLSKFEIQISNHQGWRLRENGGFVCFEFRVLSLLRNAKLMIRDLYGILV